MDAATGYLPYFLLASTSLTKSWRLIPPYLEVQHSSGQSRLLPLGTGIGGKGTNNRLSPEPRILSLSTSHTSATSTCLSLSALTFTFIISILEFDPNQNSSQATTPQPWPTTSMMYVSTPSLPHLAFHVPPVADQWAPFAVPLQRCRHSYLPLKATPGLKLAIACY